MPEKSEKFKNKPENKLWRIKIINGMKPRDFAVILTTVFISWMVGAYVGSFIFHFQDSNRPENKTISLPVQKTQLKSKNNSGSDIVLADVKDWKTYRSQKYEFEIKYPKEWPVPKEAKLSDSESRYENKISFKGFDILIRNNSKASPGVQKDEEKNNGYTKFILASSPSSYAEAANSSAGSNNSAVRITRIVKDDFYFKKVFVYHVDRGKYSYDIIPEDTNDNVADYAIASAKNEASSELRTVLSTFKFKAADPIAVKPRPATARPRISARMPASFVVSGGRMVCEKKNDHPGKSKKGKGRHMDMECCLDPDEYPNPHCYYPPSKYGKYL